VNHFVKICGLANAEDIHATVAAGPDAVGFVFWPRSPRGVTAEEVRTWTEDLAMKDVRKVGVFVDHSVEEIRRVVETAGLDVVQLHGPYTAEEISSLDLPVWRVLHADRLPEDWNRVPVEAVLLDSGTVDMPGGTGVQVNTARAIELIQKSNWPVLLAGGLKADKVGNVIETVRPSGVDVSSGVEALPGQKDLDAVRAFIKNARFAFSS
jgi:phosphoribosylanthranilate isomerase